MQGIFSSCGLMYNGPGTSVPHMGSFVCCLRSCAHGSVLIGARSLICLSILQNAILFMDRFRSVPTIGRGHILACARPSTYGGLADSIILNRVKGPLLGLALEAAEFKLLYYIDLGEFRSSRCCRPLGESANFDLTRCGRCGIARNLRPLC